MGEQRALVAATFRVASASEVARCEAALRKGLRQLAATRLPWLKKIRAKDVERHARALLAAARVAAAERKSAEEEERRKGVEEKVLLLREATAAATNKEGHSVDGAVNAAADAAAKAPSVRSTEGEEQEKDELDDGDGPEDAIIGEEEWGLYLRRPEEVAMAALDLAARERIEAEEAEEEKSGVATPVQRPRKRACFVRK